MVKPHSPSCHVFGDENVHQTMSLHSMNVYDSQSSQHWSLVAIVTSNTLDMTGERGTSSGTYVLNASPTEQADCSPLVFNKAHVDPWRAQGGPASPFDPTTLVLWLLRSLNAHVKHTAK